MRAILMYHSIDSSGSPISVDASTFRRHVEWLAASGVRVKALTDLAEGAREEDSIAITFDDGFENFGSVAWPILRDHGLPVTLFVVTDRAGTDNRWGDKRQHGIPTLPLLAWESIGRLSEEGVTLGSHTRSHPRLPGLSGDAMEDELGGSAEALADRTGSRPATFAYPYGAVDGPTTSAVRARYRVACTTVLSCVREDDPAALLPRLDMIYFRRPGRLEAWGTRRFANHLKLRRAARRVRRVALGGAP